MLSLVTKSSLHTQPCTAASLVPRLPLPSFLLHPAFIHGAIKSWGVESGNEATLQSHRAKSPRLQQQSKLHLHLFRGEVRGGVLVEPGVGQVSDDPPGCHVPAEHALPEEGVRGQ